MATKTPNKKNAARTQPARSNGKHPGGRPTKYRPEYCDQIVEYFQSPPDDQFPLLSSFAHTIGVSHQTMLTWTEEHPEFLESYARAKEMQEQTLVNRTLTGKYNPQFAIMTAKNVCGWRDKQDVDHSGGQSITVEIVDRFPKEGEMK